MESGIEVENVLWENLQYVLIIWQALLTRATRFAAKMSSNFDNTCSIPESRAKYLCLAYPFELQDMASIDTGLAHYYGDPDILTKCPLNCGEVYLLDH